MWHDLLEFAVEDIFEECSLDTLPLLRLCRRGAEVHAFEMLLSLLKFEPLSY